MCASLYTTVQIYTKTRTIITGKHDIFKASDISLCDNDANSISLCSFSHARSFELCIHITRKGICIKTESFTEAVESIRTPIVYTYSVWCSMVYLLIGNNTQSTDDRHQTVIIPFPYTLHTHTRTFTKCLYTKRIRNTQCDCFDRDVAAADIFEAYNIHCSFSTNSSICFFIILLFE